MLLQGLQESTLHMNGGRLGGRDRVLPIAYSPEWAALKEHTKEMETL